jgi:ABC-type transporter lipoprotein component MlaA/pimeloyl-ACP methyl ester carboxylesterase
MNANPLKQGAFSGSAMSPSRLGRATLATAIACSLVANSLAQTSLSLPGGPTRKTSPSDARTEIVVLPESVPDPIEPVNRVVYAINSGIMTGVVKPTADVYRRIVIKPVRTGIGNFGVNLVYPGRLINNLLQGKWDGARDETYRFCCNTTAGVAGFMDPATQWKIPKSDADFGQTFGQWGWKPECYIMLPIVGPSNERDTLGLATDTAANPLTYIAPYTLTTANPLTYFGPYTYASFAIMYNNLTDSVNEYTRFNKSQLDAYSELQYAWTFVRKNRVADFQVKGQPDPSSLETLGSVFFTFRNPDFPGRGKTRSVLIPATGRKLDFTFWLQPANAPVVYIVPGLGSHRLAETSVALAELVYEQGFSAVCVSSTFNFEFMEHASTAEVPGYTPVDVHDLHVALTEMTRRLETLYPKRLGPKVLMGYSMGAFQALFLAATNPTNAVPLLSFDRYVAINSPVGLLHGISTLDEYFDAPLAWPPAERADNIENTFLKVATLSKSSLTPRTSLPFSGIESKFLIGMAFRLTLRDAIFSSQQRHNLGILEHPIRKLRRTALYQEILQYSYQDYNQRFLIPYYWSRGIELGTPESMEKANSLRTYAASLHANKNLRLIVNRNDFLLPAEDLAWVKSTFAKDQLTVFEEGGHLGNLSDPRVQKAILESLKGVRAL